MLILIAAARRQVIEKHKVSHAASGRLSGGDVKREMHSAIDAAAGDFVGQRRKIPVIPNRIRSSAEIYLELNVVAFVKERENGC